jgi:hypothetical protein
MVSITADDYGRFGRVTEMLPAGFTYVSVSGDLDEGDVNNDTEGEVRFTLLGGGPISFTYTVTASSVERSHTFSGVLRDDDGQDQDVVGDPAVTVEAAPEPDPSATRSISPRISPPTRLPGLSTKTRRQEPTSGPRLRPPTLTTTL